MSSPILELKPSHPPNFACFVNLSLWQWRNLKNYSKIVKITPRNKRLVSAFMT